jgi:hypothetical protein
MCAMTTFRNTPAFPNDLAFHCRTFVSINSLRDDHGNPLHEVDFRDELGESAYSECPFSGPRNGKLMNHRALMEVTNCWSMITHDLKKIRQACKKTLNVDGLQLAWATSLVPMFVPLYQLFRSNRNSKPITLRSATLYKVMLDVSTTIDMYAIYNWPTYNPNIARWLGDFSDQEKFLVNGDYACAGSMAMIKRIGEILEGAKEDQTPECDYDERLYKFSNVMLAVYGIGIVFQATTAVLMDKAFIEIQSKITATWTPETPSAYESRRQFLLGMISIKKHAKVVQPIREWSLTPRLLEIHPLCVNDVLEFYDYSVSVAKRAQCEQSCRELLQLQRELESRLVCIVDKLMLIASEEGSFDMKYSGEFDFLEDPRMPGNILAKLIEA